MSARQRARIASHVALLGAKCESGMDRDCSDNESGSECRVEESHRFCFDDTDSSSVASNCDDDLGDSSALNLDTVTITHAKERPQAKNAEDVIDFLDSVIMQHNLLSAVHNSSDSATQVLYNVLFSVDDPKVFDVRSMLRRRAGDDAVAAHIAGGRGHARGMGGRGQRGRGLPVMGPNRGANKRFVFGAPSEDWPRVPSFAAGGMGMQRVNNPSCPGRSRDRDREGPPHRQDRGRTDLYTFTWSPHYTFLQSQYGYVQTTADPNLLLMFLAHFPYSHMALLQLAVVYARSGQLEKAVDLASRALYAFESAALEAFRPWGTGMHWSGRPGGSAASSGSSAPCWLDTASAPSQDFCAALLLYADLSSALGCHAAAAETARYLLSLTPDDAACVLLVLDGLLLAAGKYQLLQAFCGYSVSASQADAGSSGAREEDAGSRAQRVQKGAFCSRYRLVQPQRRQTDGDGLKRAAGMEGEEAKAESQQRPPRGLEDLPNWGYSLALSEFLMERGENERPATSSQGEASGTVLLKAALLRWPFVLRPLLAQAGASLGAGSSWESVLKHELFHRAEDRFKAGSYLSVVTDVYAKRSAALWSRGGVQAWLVHCCRDLTREIGTEGPGSVDAVVSAQVALYKDLLAPSEWNACLARYGQARATDFFGEFPPFPGNTTLVDPSLDDPQYILSGAVRFQDFMNGEGEFMFPVPAPFASTLRRRREMRRYRHRPRHHNNQRRGGGGGGEGGPGSDSESDVERNSEDSADLEGSSGDEREQSDWLEQLGAPLGLGLGQGQGQGQRGVGGGGASEGVGEGQIYGRLLRMPMGEGVGDHSQGAGVWAGRHHGAAAAAGAQGPPTQPNIDLGLPLVQLFIATLFPWIVVPPPPPPPRH